MCITRASYFTCHPATASRFAWQYATPLLLLPGCCYSLRAALLLGAAAARVMLLLTRRGMLIVVLAARWKPLLATRWKPLLAARWKPLLLLLQAGGGYALRRVAKLPDQLDGAGSEGLDEVGIGSVHHQVGDGLKLNAGAGRGHDEFGVLGADEVAKPREQLVTAHAFNLYGRVQSKESYKRGEWRGFRGVGGEFLKKGSPQWSE